MKASLRHGIRLPHQRWLRVLLGVALILGGFMWFLPVVGIWMLPLGIVVLSVDFPLVRRFRRRTYVRFSRWWTNRKAKFRNNNRAG